MRGHGRENRRGGLRDGRRRQAAPARGASGQIRPDDRGADDAEVEARRPVRHRVRRPLDGRRLPLRRDGRAAGSVQLLRVRRQGVRSPSAESNDYGPSDSLAAAASPRPSLGLSSSRPRRRPSLGRSSSRPRPRRDRPSDAPARGRGDDRSSDSPARGRGVADSPGRGGTAAGTRVVATEGAAQVFGKGVPRALVHVPRVQGRDRVRRLGRRPRPGGDGMPFKRMAPAARRCQNQPDQQSGAANFLKSGLRAPSPSPTRRETTTIVSSSFGTRRSARSASPGTGSVIGATRPTAPRPARCRTASRGGEIERTATASGPSASRATDACSAPSAPPAARP